MACSVDVLVNAWMTQATKAWRLPVKQLDKSLGQGSPHQKGVSWARCQRRTELGANVKEESSELKLVRATSREKSRMGTTYVDKQGGSNQGEARDWDARKYISRSRGTLASQISRKGKCVS